MKSTVKVAIDGDSKGLIAAAKKAEKALGDTGESAKKAGKAADGAASSVKRLGATEGLAAGKASGLSRAEQDANETLRRTRPAAEGASAGLRTLGTETERASRSSRRLAAASRSIHTAGRAIGAFGDRMTGSLAGVAGAVGVGALAKQTMDLDDNIVQMANNAAEAGKVGGQSFASWVNSTKKGVFEVAAATGQMPDAIAEGMAGILQRTGDIDLATKHIAMMGKVATATGSDVSEVGALMASLGTKANIKGPKQMEEALTLLVEQGKAGAFELKDMTANGERLFSVMNLYNGKSSKDPLQNLRSFGSFIQMSRSSVGSAEQATTAIERLGSMMANAKRVEKQLAGVGVNVKIDPNAGVEANIKKIIAAANGNLSKLTASNAFGEEGIRAIQTMSNEYAAGRGFQMYDALKEAGGDITKSTALQEMFNSRVADSKMQFQRLTAQVKQFADVGLSPVLSQMTKIASLANEHRQITQLALGAATTAVGAAVAYSGYKKAKNFISDLRGPSKVEAAAAALETAEGKRVYVTNWPGSIGGSEVYGPSRPESSAKKGNGGAPKPAEPSWRGRAVGMAGRMSRSLGGAMGLASIAGNVIAVGADGGTSTDMLGTGIGTAAGTAIGAAFGGPIGAMIGGQIGATAGPYLGKAIAAGMEGFKSLTAGPDYKTIVRNSSSNGFNGSSDATSNYSRGFRTMEQQAAYLRQRDQLYGARETMRFAGKTVNAGNFYKSDSDLMPINVHVETHIDANGAQRTKVTAPGNVTVSDEFKKMAIFNDSTLAPKWAK